MTEASILKSDWVRVWQMERLWVAELSMIKSDWVWNQILWMAEA